MQFRRVPFITQSAALLAANAIGAILYVVAASHGGWAIPEERAAGIYTTKGEPFIWFLNILPVIAIFLVMNLAWGAAIVVHRQWKSGRLWLLAAVVWLGAVAIDFAHH